MSTTEEQEDERQRQIDDALRAIGRYFVRFSRLVYQMRFAMSARLTMHGEDRIELAELMSSSSTAQQVADSFFMMCRYDAELDDNEDELRVANVLRDDVNDAISFRNQLAHGDWWVGLLQHDLGEPGHPELIRMLPKARRGNFADLTPYPPEKLDERSGRLGTLIDDITEFGLLALGLAVRVATPADGALNIRIAEGREFRISDVFTVEPGQPRRQTKTKLVRNGPRANEVLRVSIYVP